LAKESIFKRVYNFYTNDLTSTDFERVFLKETPTRYKYYVRSMEKPREYRHKFTEFLAFSRNLIIAFLKKLSPVIRIIYSVTIIIFIFSLLQESWNYAFLSFVVVNLLLIFEVADKLTARDELDVARDVQTSLIPRTPPDNSNFEIAIYYETAKEVGGDFLDFISKDDGSYYISIGDISGKGMSAALYMMQVRLLLRHLADSSENPKAILSSLNKNIFKHIKKGLYFSAVLAEVKDNNLKICRAGHTPLLYYNSVNRTCCEVKQTGMAIGLNNGNLFENSLEEFEFTTNKDDLILFYSDGLTETMNSDKTEFGLGNVKEIMINSSHKSADEICNDIKDEVTKFRGYAEVHDDLTMIILKAK
jgi:phosphoserine phosphatase RsbU/P